MLLKKKQSKFRKVLKFIIIILIIVAIIGVCYLVFYSDFCKVNNFNFKYSNNYLKSEDVSGFFSNEFLVSSLATQVVKNKKILGYLGSNNILFWKLGKKNNLTSKHILPSVKKVNIKVDLWNREVSFFAEEKSFFGIFCNNSDGCYAFDNNGIVFAPAPKSKGSLILKINDSNKRPIVLGERILPEKEWFNNIINAINLIKKNNLNIESINIKDLDLEEWGVKIANGPELIFSLNFVPSDLNEILKTLKDRTDFPDINYFDMRVENRIYYHPNEQ